MKKKILICEDDTDILELLEVILGPDYNVVGVNRVENILNVVAKHEPDIILMDIWIPTMGGEAAITALKSMPTTSKIPVIFISANDKIVDVTTRAGGDAFLKKPFDIKECRALVKELLEKKQVNKG